MRPVNLYLILYTITQLINCLTLSNNNKSFESLTATLPTKHVNLHITSSLVEPDSSQPSSLYTLWNIFMVVVLVLTAGLASGLTLGLLSLDPVQLKVYEVQGSEKERKQIQSVIELILQHHLLLVTLLLVNSIAMEALPVFFERLVRPWIAVFFSVTLILIFGEIFPQAFCLGKWQIPIAKAAAPTIKVLMTVLLPVTWPIAKILDYFVGNGSQPSYYARAHLKALIRLHERENKKTTEIQNVDYTLGSDEVNVIEGALDLAEKYVVNIMVPLESVFMLEHDTLLDQKTIQTILETGHSRIPIYQGNKHNIKGIILVKSLLTINSNLNKKVSEVMTARRIIFVDPYAKVYDLLNEFQKGHSHIAFVTCQHAIYTQCLNRNENPPSSCILQGIATLEDIIEELIQKEIYDEFDNNETINSNQFAIKSSISTHHPNVRTNKTVYSDDLPEIVKQINKRAYTTVKKYPVDITNSDISIPFIPSEN